MSELLKISVHEVKGPDSFFLEYRGIGADRAYFMRQLTRGSSMHYSRLVDPCMQDEEKRDLIEWLGREGQPLQHPEKCQVCKPARQAILWRTFTDQSWKTFLDHDYESLPIDNRKRLSEYKGNSVFSEEYLNRPGTLWTAKDPRFALAVGLSRRLLLGETVRLFGFTVCQHDLDKGIELHNVHEFMDPEKRIMIPLSIKDLVKGDFMFSSGIIINRIPPEILTRAIEYEVKADEFDPIQEVIKHMRVSTKEALVHYLYIVSNLLSSMMNVLIGIGGIEDPVMCINKIIPTLKPLLGNSNAITLAR